MSESIPTVGRLPVVGGALEVGRDTFAFLERAPREYGPVFRVSVPGLSFVCYADADLAERVLVAERDRYRKGDREIELLGDFLGEGILATRGETWKRGREQVQPAFYPGRVREYGDVMIEETEALVAGWRHGEHVDVHDAATELTLDIVVRTLFGLERMDEAETVGRAVDAITAWFEPSGIPAELPLWVPTPANRRFRRAAADLDGVIERLIERRLAEGAVADGAAVDGPNAPADGTDAAGAGDGDGDPPDLCGTLLAGVEAGRLTEEQVRDHLVTMLLAGHETTAIALAYALGLLATHPEERERVREEVRSVDALTPDTELPRTDRVVRETLRLYPPAYMLFRQTTQPDTVAGYEVPADTPVVLPQWSIQRDRRYYEDPLEFRPGRWTPEMRETLPDFAYFPFGGGERVCIGRRFALLELRLALAAILRAVDLEALPETELSPTPALTCRPEGPVWLRVRR